MQELWSMAASAQEDPSDSGLPRILLEEKKAEMEARRKAEQDLKVGGKRAEMERRWGREEGGGGKEIGVQMERG